jgi:hypothetical protein
VAVGVVVGGAALPVGEGHRREGGAAGGPILGDEDVAVAEELASAAALLHEEPEAVAGEGVGGEVEVPLEEPHECGGEGGALTQSVHAREERVRQPSAHRGDPRLHGDTHRLHAPAVRRSRHLVALDWRPPIGDGSGVLLARCHDQPLAGSETPEIHNAPEPGDDLGGVGTGEAAAAQRRLQGLAAPEEDLYGGGGSGGNVLRRAHREGRRGIDGRRGPAEEAGGGEAADEEKSRWRAHGPRHHTPGRRARQASPRKQA